MSDGLEWVRQWLRDRGVGDDEIDQAVKEDQLHLLVIDRSIIPGSAHLTARQVAEGAGLTFDLTRRLWRALGFPEVADDVPGFSQLDVEALNSVRALLAVGFADTDSTLQMTRVIGSAMATIAEADVESSPLLHSNLPRADMAARYARASDEALPAVARLLEYTWRRHLQAAMRRSALVSRMSDGGQVVLAVGFADLVGFTVLSQQLSTHALAEVVARFEDLAYDTVSQRGGRVVKMIGDEVMFTALEPDQGAEIGLALAEAYADDEMLSDVRVGLSCGGVLLRDGDCYGPVVNLAKRIVNIAVPGTVVVSDSMHSALAEDTRYRWRQLRPRYLKGLGRVPLWVLRRTGAHDTEGFRSRRRWFVPEPVRERIEHTFGRLPTQPTEATEPMPGAPPTRRADAGVTKQ